jgi:hypothetical protein
MSFNAISNHHRVISQILNMDSSINSMESFESAYKHCTEPDRYELYVKYMEVMLPLEGKQISSKVFVEKIVPDVPELIKVFSYKSTRAYKTEDNSIVIVVTKLDSYKLLIKHKEVIEQRLHDYNGYNLVIKGLLSRYINR